MIIGIDAINIRTGGGLNHLKEVLLNLDPVSLNIKKVVIWGTKPTLDTIINSDWIKKIDVGHIANSWKSILWWNLNTIEKELNFQNCDILFVPGGTYLGRFRPYVSMIQNLLPFEKIERKKYRFSKTFFRYIILELLQKYTFKNANGVIFLSNHSYEKITRDYYLPKEVKTKVIYHGVDQSYFIDSSKNFKKDRKTIKLLYVSIINYYKNQKNVVKALRKLIDKKYDIELDLVGPAYPLALNDLNKTICQNKLNDKVNYLGELNKDLIIEKYKNSDIFVFASSCETFGMIVLESMAAGLPIACSNRSAMPEILNDNAEYFDPDDPNEISSAIESIIINKSKSKKLSFESQKRARIFSWEKCSKETFEFISSLMIERVKIL
tara:strand:- start:29494 stop:30633 length:1140 start_codon:yes stop_codon:yes gene_type:complete